jgi:predicted DsbA family dithiol-disulfide isomerase
VIDRYGVVGAQPYETLEGLVQKARQAKSEA